MISYMDWIEEKLGKGNVPAYSGDRSAWEGCPYSWVDLHCVWDTQIESVDTWRTLSKEWRTLVKSNKVCFESLCK